MIPDYYRGVDQFSEMPLEDVKADIDDLYEMYEPSDGNVLSHSQIIERVKAFMLFEYDRLLSRAMANEYELDSRSIEDDDATRMRLDPVEMWKNNPKLHSEIYNFVKLRMHDCEELLLAKSAQCLVSYNTLLFGSGIKMKEGEELSAELRQFVSNHLMNPSPPIVSKRSGRPAYDVERNNLCINSIRFATLYGINATAGEGKNRKFNACGAVESAKRKILNENKIEYFNRGFEESSLMKLWQKRDK